MREIGIMFDKFLCIKQLIIKNVSFNVKTILECQYSFYIENMNNFNGMT